MIVHPQPERTAALGRCDEQTANGEHRAVVDAANQTGYWITRQWIGAIRPATDIRAAAIGAVKAMFRVTAPLAGKIFDTELIASLNADAGTLPFPNGGYGKGRCANGSRIATGARQRSYTRPVLEYKKGRQRSDNHRYEQQDAVGNENAARPRGGQRLGLVVFAFGFLAIEHSSSLRN
jgi:hypothetical protein